MSSNTAILGGAEQPHLLCDDVRQHIIGFLGTPLSAIGVGHDPLEVGCASTFPLLQSSLKASASADRKKPTKKQSIVSGPTKSKSLLASQSKVAIGMISKPGRTKGVPTTGQPTTTATQAAACNTKDEFLTVQLICKAWNKSFHRTCLDATHVVVRRAIICRSRFIRQRRSGQVATSAGAEDMQEQSVEALRDLAELSSQQKTFLQANEAAVRAFEESKVAWAASVRALDSLSMNAVMELRSFSNPPARVVMVLEAVMRLLKQDTSWASAKLVMKDASGFLRMMTHFPKHTVTAKTLRDLRQWTSHPAFNVPSIATASIAAAGFCQWVLGLESYAQVGLELAASGDADVAIRFDLAKEIMSLHAQQQKGMQPPPNAATGAGTAGLM